MKNGAPDSGKGEVARGQNQVGKKMADMEEKGGGRDSLRMKKMVRG